MKIRSADGNETLLKVIKNPMSRHLPAGIRCYGMSQLGQLYSPIHFASQLPDDTPVAFVIGAFAVGAINPIDHPYVSNIFF